MPWFSPPAMQYVARFVGNPHGYTHQGDLEDDVFAMLPDSAEGIASSLHLPVHVVLKALRKDPAAVERDGTWFPDEWEEEKAALTNPRRGPAPMPFLEWGTKTKGHGLLDYMDGYTGPPSFDKRSNPWFSPPAMQYVARFTGNPLASIWCPDCGLRVCEPEEIDSYTERSCRCGSDLLWEDNPLGGEAYYDASSEYGHHCPEDPHDACPICGGDPVCPGCPECLESNPAFHPGGGVRRGGRYYPGGGRRHHGGFHPGGGRHYRGKYHPGGGHYERNPEARHDVLCQCGWGRLGMPESEIPSRCPVCNHPIGARGGGRSDEYWKGVASEQEDWDDPSWGAAYGDDWSNNPSYFTRGRGAVARPFSRGTLHRTMETDPMHESRMKGMLAFYGKKLFGVELSPRTVDSMLGKGRKELGNRTVKAKHAVKKGKIRVGNREIPVGPIKRGQKVKLADVKARADAVFYAQSRQLGTLEGVSISEDTVPGVAKGRRPAPKKRLPKRKKAKKKAKRRVVANPKKKVKRKKAVPPASKRCVKKVKSGGRCKGRKLPGKDVCVCHSSRSSMKRKRA